MKDQMKLQGAAQRGQILLIPCQLPTTDPLASFDPIQKNML
jgi:hypothetical protein